MRILRIFRIIDINEMLLKKPYYFSVKMGRYIAAIIDNMNKGDSLRAIVKPAERIKETIENYKKNEA